MDLLSLDPHVKVQQMHYALVVQSCPTLWDTDCSCQALLSMEFSSQEYWSGLPLLSPGDLPDPGIEPTSPVAPALAGEFFTTELPGKP